MGGAAKRGAINNLRVTVMNWSIARRLAGSGLALMTFATPALASDPPTSSHIRKLLSRDPAATHYSSFPREKTAACLATAGFLGDVSIVPREQDTLALINIGGRTHSAIVITDEANGSKMVVRRVSGVITVGSIKPALKCVDDA